MRSCRAMPSRNKPLDWSATAARELIYEEGVDAIHILHCWHQSRQRIFDDARRVDDDGWMR